MKTDIHPEYTEAQVVCTCGNQFTTRSTQSTISVEICSQCHPFYTGKQKLMDTGGRVERFRRRAAAAAAKKGETPAGGAPAAAAEAAPAAAEAPAAEAAPAAEEVAAS